MDPSAIVKRSRTRNGLTQARLAERMSTTQAAIARLERPGSNPRIGTLVRAIEAAGDRLVLHAEKAPAGELDLDQLRMHQRLTPQERADAHDRAYSETRDLVAAARASG